MAVGLLAGCNSAETSPVLQGAASLASADTGQVLGASTNEPTGCLAGPDAEVLARQILTLVNLERAREGVAPLTWNDTLATVAADYACTLADKDFFDHVDPDTGEGPGDRATAAGYVYFGVGENLAAGQTSSAEAVESWMDSPPHRENLLSPIWTETGVGVRWGGSYRVYWVQEFGSPATTASHLTAAGVH